MKTLSGAIFFRVFDMLADIGNPGLKLKSWNYAGAHWRRDRYSLSGAEYTFIVEAFAVDHAARPRWKLLIVKEHWWDEDHNPIRDVRWARPTAGRRADVLAWFRKLEQEIIEPGPQ